jgi:hypothetical protein
MNDFTKEYNNPILVKTLYELIGEIICDYLYFHIPTEGKMKILNYAVTEKLRQDTMKSLKRNMDLLIQGYKEYE